MAGTLRRAAFVALILTIWGTFSDASDPCTSYTTINDVKRSTNHRLRQGESALCDDKLTQGWYRFTSKAGGRMPETKPPPNSCGTVAPIWIRGTHPTVNGQEKQVTACTNIRDMSGGCLLSTTISIKNCGGFYVYKLKPQYGCPRAYCAENFGNFTFTMNLFKSTNYRDSYLPFEYPVVVTINQPLWIEFRVKDTISDLVVFADNCRATTSTNPNSSPQYEFLRSGCALDPTMSYNYDPNSSVQRFSIKSFRFIHDNNKLVYLHCELLVCHRNSDNSRCSRGCIAARKRRAADSFEDTSDPMKLSIGPFDGEGDNSGSNTKATNDGENGTNLIMVTSLVVVGTLLLLVSGLFIAFRIKSRRRKARRPAGPVAVNSYENEGTADCTDEKKESCEMQAKI